MSVTFDVSNDFETVVDGLSICTLTRAADGTTETLGTVLAPACLRRNISAREAGQSEGKYTTSDVRWHIDSEVPSGAPKLGDTLTDVVGIVWTILEVDIATFGTRYACTCRNLAIASGLDQYVTLQRANMTTGASGQQVPSWQNLYANVQAKVQKLSATPQQSHGTRFMRNTYMVYLSQTYALAEADRILWKDKVLTIERMEHPDDIAALSQVLCNDGPWGLA